MGKTFTDGQLAASESAILTYNTDVGTTGKGQTFAATFTNVGGSQETILLTFQRRGGTSRRLRRVVLSANEQFVMNGLTMSPEDILLGSTSNASSVDYVVSSSGDGPLQFQTFDANGSLKSGSASFSGNVSTSGSVEATGGFTFPVVARTATSDGLTTGTIADAGLIQHVTVTSANAAHIIVLPTPTPGTIVILDVGANGFELRSDTPASVAINGGTGASAESAIAANSTVIAICLSATAWKAFFLDADSDVAKVEAAA